MHSRKLGPFAVSAIGLGVMNISGGYGPRLSDSDGQELLLKALDHGYDFFDTASLYGMGHNEEQVGKALAHRRSEYTLASKCGIKTNSEGQSESNGRPEVLIKTCEESLKRLKTNVIDLYYLHRIDKNVPVEESVGALSRLVEQGKIRTIGLSEVSSDSLERAHATFPITALQSEYSLWSRTPERKVLQTCRELDITFIAFSPLGRQFLTGKSSDCVSLDETDPQNYRATIARPRFELDNFVGNIKLLVPLVEIANNHDCSLAQLSLAWLLAKGKDIIPIPGTSNLKHLKENADAGDIKLSLETVKELDSLINDDVIKGERYNAFLMETVDSERD
ncbi:MAG: aryl-alcohol dehydrogenase-like predicted oxidoreductase [Cocleimonas sp.]|jgi:aryl-alcohol dehydrogenase-like predicted oxidoreductase